MIDGVTVVVCQVTVKQLKYIIKNQKKAGINVFFIHIPYKYRLIEKE